VVVVVVVGVLGARYGESDQVTNHVKGRVFFMGRFFSPQNFEMPKCIIHALKSFYVFFWHFYFSPHNTGCVAHLYYL